MTQEEVRKIDLCADLLDPPAPGVVHKLVEEINRLRQWVSDCQSGMYVNCVYCGHRYGPLQNTPVAQADILKEHISICPDHPMSQIKRKYLDLVNYINSLVVYYNNTDGQKSVLNDILKYIEESKSEK